MKASLKKVKDCRFRMFVEVGAELVEYRFQQVLKDFQKAARIPGYREGKAPAQMVEKQFLRQAHEEVLKSLVSEAYHQSVHDQKASPVSLPSVSDIQMERGKKLTFTAEFENSPEVSIRNYKGIRLKRVSMEVSPQDVEQGLKSLLESKADLVPVLEVRPVQRGDFLVCDIEVLQEGETRSGRKGVLLYVEPNATDDFCEKVVGASVDDVREISRAAGPAEKPAAAGAGVKPYSRVWIRAIKQKRLPELDNEFAKAFGKENLDDLRQAVRKDIASYRQSAALEKMKKELFEKLFSMTSFTVPESLVEKQKGYLVEEARRHYARQGVSEEKFGEAKEKVSQEADARARDEVRLHFIFKKVAELEGIEPNEDELAQRLSAIAQESKRPIEEVRHVFEEDIRQNMTQAKTIDFLMANARFEEEK